MKRALLISALLSIGCASRGEPIPLPPPAAETTLSVLEPDGGDRCLWKRAQPDGARTLCSMPIACEHVDVVFTADGSAALARPDSFGVPPWVCVGSDSTRDPDALPPLPSDAELGFHDTSVVVGWEITRGPSLLQRARHRLDPAAPIATPEPVPRMLALTRSGWREAAADDPPSWNGTRPLQVSPGFDGIDEQARGLSVPQPPTGPLARLVSEALPPAHPPVHWTGLATSPSAQPEAFLQGGREDQPSTGPLVFLLREEDARLAPETPGEADEVEQQLRGTLVLLQSVDPGASWRPHLWDASTGELLWSDPNAVRAVFWPRP